MSSKRCRWLDLNPSRLVSEATALSFAPQQQFKLCLKFTTTLSVKLFTSGRLLSKWTKICLFFLLSSIQWNIEHNRLHMEKAQMACLGFEPVTAGWKVQTTPLSYRCTTSIFYTMWTNSEAPTKKFIYSLSMRCRRSSVESSAPSILPPRLWIPCTPSKLLLI